MCTGAAGEEIAVLETPSSRTLAEGFVIQIQDEVRDGIEHLVVTAAGRAHVSAALFEAGLDGLHPCAREMALPGDREWVREALAGPVAAATDAALEVLTDTLAEALRGAPPDLLERLESCRRWSELGLE
ncbi:MAG TPA: hypothetical protein VFK38_11060 [Candidatus Limnocylindrales bacterium]|nr:hypothetical protein [Candidatus Limnocylindrales bacterium]